MRVLELVVGRLHINLFHNRIQYIVLGNRRRYCSFVYRPSFHAVDRTESEKSLPGAIVNAAIKKGMQSKRAQKLNLFPPEVVRYFEDLWSRKRRSKPPEED